MGIQEIRNIKAGVGRKKENTYTGPKKKSDKKIAQEQADRDSGKDAAQDKWFDDRGKELTGRCLFCGGKTMKVKSKSFYATEADYEKALFLQRNSVAHLFPKRKNMFPSIAEHPENSIELCFYENSCHTNFDTNMISWEDVKNNFPDAWSEIIRKTLILYPVMTKQEQNKVPEILLNEIKIQS